MAFPDDRGRQSRQGITEILNAAGVQPRYPLVRADGTLTNDVETRIFDNGGVTIVALQRDFPAAPGSADLAKIPNGREAVVLALPRPLYVYDLRKGRALGSTESLPIELGPIEPVLLALSEKPVAPPVVSGPRSVHLGANAEISVLLDTPAALDVIHFDAIDPEGNTVAHYSGNLLVTQGRTAKILPFAVNDKPGVWTIRAKDVLSGAMGTAELNLEP
jgi:hypothetical protein